MKLVLILMLAFLGGNLFAQNFQRTSEGAVIMKLRLRHSGDTRCVGGASGCRCPLGICFTRGFEQVDPQNALGEDEGIGQASVFGTPTVVYLDPPRNQVSKKVGYIKVVFQQPTALEDGTIPADSDYTINEDFAKELGYNSITILRGTYHAQPSPKSAYGEVILTCNLN